MEQYIAGIDIGTTGAKTIIFDLEGNKVSSAYREYKCVYPNPNWVEQDPVELVEAAMSSCKEAIEKSGLSAAQIASVGFSPQRCCSVFLDANERPLKMISWQDNRSGEELKSIAGLVGAAEFTRVSGLPLSTTWILPKMMWVQKNDPELWGKTARFVQLHDYLLRCFGADDYYLSETDAGFYGCWEVSKLAWNEDFLKTFHMDLNKTSKIRPTGMQVGVVSEAAAKKSGLRTGLPLCIGPGDQSSAALGAGVIHPGDVSVSLGTGGMCVICRGDPGNDPNGAFFTTNHVIHGLWEWEGIQNASAGIYRWFRDEIASLEYAQAQAANQDVYDKLSEMAAKVPAGSRGLMLLPHFASAGTPRWNSNARGTLFGLTLAHDKACMARAFMEGIVMEHRDMMESVRGPGVQFSGVRIMGGPTKSPVWNQIQADVYGLKVETLKIPDASVLGAAITGAVGAGLFAGFEEAVERLVKVDQVYTPIPENVEKYNRLYEVYRAAYEGLQQSNAFDKIAKFQADFA